MDLELLALPKSSAGEKILIPPPKSLPLDDLPMWKKLPFDNKYPVPELPERDTQLYTTKLGETLYHTYPGKKFDLTGTEKHSVPAQSYNPLHDPNLRLYFQSTPSYKSLLSKGLITADGKVKADITEYNQYRMYLHHLWVMENDQLRQNQEAEEEKRLQSLLEAVENDDSLCKNIIDNQDIINADIVMDKLATKLKEGDFGLECSENSLIRSLINWKCYQKKLEKNYKNDYPALKQWLNDQTKNYKYLMEKKINARKCKDRNMRLRWEKLRENSRNSYNRVTKLQEKHKERQRMLSEKRQNLYKKMWNRHKHEISQRASKLHQKAYPNEGTSVLKDMASQDTSGITDRSAEFPKLEDLSTEDARKNSFSSRDLRCLVTDYSYEWDDSIDNFTKSYRKTPSKEIKDFYKRPYLSSSDQKSSFDSSDTWVTTSDGQADVASGTDTGINESVKKKIRLSLSDSSSEEKRIAGIPYENKNSSQLRKFSSTDNDFLDSSLEKSKITKKPSKQQRMKKRGKIKGKSTKSKLLSPYQTSIKGDSISSTTSKEHRFCEQQHMKASKESNRDKHGIRTPKRYSSLDADDSSMLLKYLYGLPGSPGDIKKIPSNDTVQLKEQQKKKPESQFSTECESTDLSKSNETEKGAVNYNGQQSKPKDSAPEKQSEFLNGLHKKAHSPDEQLRKSDSRTSREKKSFKPTSPTEKRNKDRFQPVTDLRTMKAVNSEFSERRPPQYTQEVSEKERQSEVSKPIKDHELKAKQQVGTEKELKLKGLEKDSVEKTEIQNKSPKAVLNEGGKPISATAKDSETGKIFKSRQVNEKVKHTKGKSKIPCKENGKDKKEISTKKENGNKIPVGKTRKQSDDSEELERKKKFALREDLKSEFHKDTGRVSEMSKSKESSPDTSSTDVRFTSKEGIPPAKTKQKDYFEDVKISKELSSENKIADRQISPAETILKSTKKDDMMLKIKDALKRAPKSEHRKDKGKGSELSSKKESRYEYSLTDVPSNVKEGIFPSKTKKKEDVKDGRISKKLSPKDKSKEHRKLLSEYKPESSWPNDKVQEKDELKLKMKGTLKRTNNSEINKEEGKDSKSTSRKDNSPETSCTDIPPTTKESTTVSITKDTEEYEDARISKRLSSKDKTKEHEMKSSESITKRLLPDDTCSGKDKLKPKDTVNYSPRREFRKGVGKDLEISSSKEIIPENFLTQIPSESRESGTLLKTKKEEDVLDIRTSQESTGNYKTKIHDMLTDESSEKGRSPGDKSGGKDELKQKAKETNKKVPEKYDKKFQRKDDLKKAHISKHPEEIGKDSEESSSVGSTPEFSRMDVLSTIEESVPQSTTKKKEELGDHRISKELPAEEKAKQDKILFQESTPGTCEEDYMKPRTKDALKNVPKSESREDFRKDSDMCSEEERSPKSSTMDAPLKSKESIPKSTTGKREVFRNGKISKGSTVKEKIKENEIMPKFLEKNEEQFGVKSISKDALTSSPKSKRREHLGKDSDASSSEEYSRGSTTPDVPSSAMKSAIPSTIMNRHGFRSDKNSKRLPNKVNKTERRINQRGIVTGSHAKDDIKSGTKDTLKNSPTSELPEDLGKDSAVNNSNENIPESLLIDVPTTPKKRMSPSTTKRKEDFRDDRISKELPSEKETAERKTVPRFDHKIEEEDDKKPKAKDALKKAPNSRLHGDIRKDYDVSSSEDDSAKSYQKDAPSTTKESALPSSNKKKKHLEDDRIPKRLSAKEQFREHPQEIIKGSYKEAIAKASLKEAHRKEYPDGSKMSSGEERMPEAPLVDVLSITKESVSTQTTKKKETIRDDRTPKYLPTKEKNGRRETISRSDKKGEEQFEIKPKTKDVLKRTSISEHRGDSDKDTSIYSNSSHDPVAVVAEKSRILEGFFEAAYQDRKRKVDEELNRYVASRRDENRLHKENILSEFSPSTIDFFTSDIKSEKFKKDDKADEKIHFDLDYNVVKERGSIGKDLETFIGESRKTENILKTKEDKTVIESDEAAIEGYIPARKLIESESQDIKERIIETQEVEMKGEKLKSELDDESIKERVDSKDKDGLRGKKLEQTKDEIQKKNEELEIKAAYKNAKKDIDYNAKDGFAKTKLEETKHETETIKISEKQDAGVRRQNIKCVDPTLVESETEGLPGKSEDEYFKRSSYEDPSKKNVFSMDTPSITEESVLSSTKKEREDLGVERIPKRLLAKEHPQENITGPYEEDDMKSRTNDALKKAPKNECREDSEMSSGEERSPKPSLMDIPSTTKESVPTPTTKKKGDFRDGRISKDLPAKEKSVGRETISRSDEKSDEQFDIKSRIKDALKRTNKSERRGDLGKDPDVSSSEEYSFESYALDVPSTAKESAHPSKTEQRADLGGGRLSEHLPAKEIFKEQKIHTRESITDFYEIDDVKSKINDALTKVSRSEFPEDLGKDADVSSSEESSPETLFVEVPSTTKANVLPSVTKKEEDLEEGRISKGLPAKIKMKEFERLTSESMIKSSMFDLKGHKKDSQNTDPEQGAETDRSASSLKEGTSSEMIESTSNAIFNAGRDFKNEKSSDSQPISSPEKSEGKTQQKIKKNEKYFFFHKQKLYSHGIKNKSPGPTKQNKSKVDVYKDVIEADDNISSPVCKSPEKLKKGFPLKSKVDENFLFQEPNLCKRNIDDGEPNLDSGRKREEQENITNNDVVDRTGKESASHSKGSLEIKRAFDSYRFLFQKPRFRKTHFRENKPPPFAEQYDVERGDRYKAKQGSSDVLNRKIYEERKKKIYDDFERYVLSKRNASIYYDSSHGPEIASAEKSHELEELFKDAYQDRKRKVDEELNRYIASRKHENRLDTADILPKIPTTPIDFHRSDVKNEDIMKDKSVKEHVDNNEKDGFTETNSEQIKDETEKKGEKLKTEPVDKSVKEHVDQNEKDSFTETKSEQIKDETEKKSEKLKTIPAVKSAKECVDQNGKVGFTETKLEQIKDETKKKDEKLETKPADKSIKERDETIEIKREKKYVYKIDGKKYLYFTRISIPLDQTTSFPFSKELDPKDCAATYTPSFTNVPTLSTLSLKGIDNKEKQYEVFILENAPSEYKKATSIRSPEKVQTKAPDDLEFIESTDVSVVDHSNKFERAEIFSTANLISHITKEARGLEYVCTKSEPLIKLSDNVYVSPNETSFGKRTSSIAPEIFYQDPTLKNVKEQLIYGLQKLLHSTAPPLCNLEQAEEQQCSEFYAVCPSDESLKQQPTQLESIMKVSSFDVENRENVLNVTKDFLFVTPSQEAIQGLEVVDENLDWVVTHFQDPLKMPTITISPPTIKESNDFSERAAYFLQSKKDTMSQNVYFPISLPDAYFETTNKIDLLLDRMPVQTLEDVNRTQEENASREASIMFDKSTVKQKYHSLKKTLPFLKSALYGSEKEIEDTSLAISLPDAYYGSGSESDLTTNWISAPFNSADRKMKILGEYEKMDVMEDIPKEKQKYQILEKTLPPTETQDITDDKKFKDDIPKLAVSIPDAFYGTRSEINSMSGWISEPMSKVGSKMQALGTFKKARLVGGISKGKEKFNRLDKILPPTKTEDTMIDMELKENIPKTSEKRQKYHNLRKFLPPSIPETVSIELKSSSLQSSNVNNTLINIALPDAYYGTASTDDSFELYLSDKVCEEAHAFEKIQKYHALQKNLPPSKPTIISDVESKNMINQFSLEDDKIALPNAYFATGDKRSPTLGSLKAYQINDIKDKSRRKEKDKVDFKRFEGRQKYHILKKFLPPSKFEITEDIKNNICDDSIEIGLIQLPNAYYGTGNESRIAFPRDFFSCETREVDVSSNVICDWMDKQKYYNLTKVLPPPKPKSDITADDMIDKNIPLQHASKFHIRPKFLSLDTKELVRLGPFKVSEVEPVAQTPIRLTQDTFKRHKQTEILEFSEDFANVLQHLLNEEPDVVTSAKDISILKQKPLSIEITGELLTLLKTLQNRLLESHMESHRERRLYSIAPVFGTSYENQTWDSTFDLENCTLLVDATKTDPVIFIINKSSDPNTTIEMNITEFLKPPVSQSLDTFGMEEPSTSTVERQPPKFSETAVTPSSNVDRIEVIERPDSSKTQTLARDSEVHLQNPVIIRTISADMDRTPKKDKHKDFQKEGLEEDIIETIKGITAKRVISKTLPRKQIVRSDSRARNFDQLYRDTHSLQHFETDSNQTSDDDEEKTDQRESEEELEERHMREIEKEDIYKDENQISEKQSENFHELDKLHKLPADKLFDLISTENLAQIDDEGRQEVMWSQGPSTSYIDVQHTREELQLLIPESPDNRRRGTSDILNKIKGGINRLESVCFNEIKSRSRKKRSKTERERKAAKIIFKTDNIHDETIVTADSDSEETNSS
ncbi:hypothetical protein AVEN_197903-1 [Araneus ventricosus]|uniref:Uncharacterized protein n=1 Tax=Araneus ventricosus TaxID=182803 RepID=A0A4Y2CK17_ARAVE|nr:hypothetical protein AVEN_197903-1 [Araneus ventricosus]